MRIQRHHRLTGIDPDAHLQRQPRIGLVQLLDRLQDPQPGADGALGVILVRHRSPEHGHHGIPDELLHRPAVRFDLRAHTLVVRPDPRAHILGIRPLGCGGEPDQVAEQHRHHLPLLQRRRGRRLGKRRAAKRTERKLARKFRATGRARRHLPSLGQAVRRHDPESG